MRTVFRYLKKFRVAIVIVVCLLIFQAICDMALPDYTSDLLNVGLQQGGIQDGVPDTVRTETLARLELFLAEGDVGTVEAAYGPADQDGIRSLEKGADRETLAALLSIPDSAVYQLTRSEEGTNSLAMLQQMLDAGMVTREQIQQQLEGEMDSLSDSTVLYLNQIATAFVSDEYAAQGKDLNAIRNRYLFQVGGKMLLMCLGMAVLSVIVGYLASRISAGLGRDLRRGLFQQVMRYTSTEIEQFSTASLITRCTNDIMQVQFAAVMLLRMVAYAPILAIVGVIRVIEIGSDMSWIIVAAVLALAVCIAILFVVAYPKFRIMQQLVDRVNLVSREMLTGIMPIRAFVRQKHEEKRFEGANKDLMRTQLFTNRVMTFMSPVMTMIMNGVSVLIVWVGGHGVDQGSVQVGDLTAFITYSMVIIMGFLMLSMVSVMLPRAGVAANRIAEVLNTPVSLQDPAQPEDIKIASGKGEIAFHDVSFAYPGADDCVLEHITFTASPGKTTAIIGSTGCGKSTLIHLIPRFYDVTKGSITMDGVDIRNLNQRTLRDAIGYVPQKGMLFSGTVESNLKYAGEQVSDEDMKEAARIAQAEGFVLEKPDGYQSAIAQNGSNVSGGQRQRLSIARAVAKHPKVFLFDDTFSALDYKTDAALRAALARSTKDAVVIIVAQRISTILQADQILVMEEGRIVGQGTHSALLQNCPTYLEIARGQLSEEEIQAGMKGGK